MAEDKNKALDPIESAPPQMGETLKENTTHDAIFGEVTEHGPNYRNVSPLRAVIPFLSKIIKAS